MRTLLNGGKPGASHQVFRLLSLILATLVLSGCRAAMDTEYFEQHRTVTWAIVRPEDGAAEKLGLYRHDGPSTAKFGLAALLNATTRSDPWQGVLGPGDRLVASAHTPPPTLERRSDVVLRQVKGPGPIEARPFMYNGRCEVAAYQAVELSQAIVVERIRRSPVRYRSRGTGNEFSASEAGFMEASVALFLLPLVVLVWVLSGFDVEGGPPSGFEVIEYREDLVGTHLVEPDLTSRYAYLRPVEGQEVLWAIEYSDSDEPTELWGTLTTDASGRALVPLQQHSSSLLRGAASGKAAIFSVGLPGAGNAVSMTVDLGELKLDH